MKIMKTDVTIIMTVGSGVARVWWTHASFVYKDINMNMEMLVRV
eukprot:CAMPEP_0114394056 /NCGR_PEP_ID=MMETSP0102-20121206/11954_1 /TAXON_ID=38822 ORGANISM="Pteridomonas danica, Strain PT" /NCGR_SAMPLE_ID=MMETSP0102 /ASSEMBLY_ACC=CAM_ASM_000212 /LENGTH=43 /DNA_ID= /DNA_START= /DNA_END= /DNA_ORIENTATION=